MKSLTLRFLAATAIALTLVNHLGIDIPATHSEQSWLQGDRAEARRGSGGRAGGGSFRRSSSSPSRSSDSSPSRSNGSTWRSSDSSYGYRSGYSSFRWLWSASDDALFLRLLMLLLLIGGGIAAGLLIYLILKQQSPQQSLAQELDNDVVTVTKLQVGLLAQARHVQAELTQLTKTADTNSPEGLTELMHESVLALLRSPEYWTHVSASSQTLRTREEAEQVFKQISIAERSRFSAETLVNVGGRLRRQALKLEADDPASYIVVTLLIGSADDRSLFNPQIHTAEELQTTLQILGGMTSDYLMVFELLWSPQDAADSLSYDELLSEYPHLKPLV